MLNAKKTRPFPLPFFTPSLRLPIHWQPAVGGYEWKAVGWVLILLLVNASHTRGNTACLTILLITQLQGGDHAPAWSSPGHNPALQVNGSWLLLPQTRAMPPVFPTFTQSPSSCSCLATDKHLIGRGNEQRWSCLGMKAEDSCLTKSFLKHNSLRDLPTTIFSTALTRKWSDYRVAVWLGSLHLTTKQLAEENSFKQLLLSGHKQDVCYAGRKPQTQWIKQQRRCSCHTAKGIPLCSLWAMGHGKARETLVSNSAAVSCTVQQLNSTLKDIKTTLNTNQ